MHTIARRAPSPKISRHLKFEKHQTLCGQRSAKFANRVPPVPQSRLRSVGGPRPSPAAPEVATPQRCRNLDQGARPLRPPSPKHTQSQDVQSTNNEGRKILLQKTEHSETFFHRFHVQRRDYSVQTQPVELQRTAQSLAFCWQLELMSARYSWVSPTIFCVMARSPSAVACPRDPWAQPRRESSSPQSLR